MNTTTTKPAIIQLDDASRSPSKTLSEYCKNCSNAVTNALNEFPVVQKTANCKISHGFVKENALISMLWTTTFENPPNNLLDIFEELFGGDGENLKKHALEWDNTFHNAELIGKIDSTIAGDDLKMPPLLVQWQFNASPLAGREMVYVFSAKKEKPTANDKWLSRITYSYASVHDDWIHSVTKHEVKATSGRTRSMNCFPSCDRVTVYKEKVQLDHMMTTDIGGWVPTFCFNNLFKGALVDANCHESERMRAYALSLCTT